MMGLSLVLLSSALTPPQVQHLRASRPRLPSCTMREAGWIPGGVAPSYLDGSLPGDVGFDPLCYAALARTGTGSDSSPWRNTDRKTQMLMMSKYEAQRKVRWMREAEIKHARLAMMATAGWPLAELLDKPLSKLLGLPYALEATGGRAPSLFNGHLLDGPSANLKVGTPRRVVVKIISKRDRLNLRGKTS